MIAIGIERPDAGNVVAVRPDLPLIKGIGPVMNIILAYSTHINIPHIFVSTDHNQPATLPSSPSKQSLKILVISKKPYLWSKVLP
jgi:hypothetical protein